MFRLSRVRSIQRFGVVALVVCFWVGGNLSLFAQSQRLFEIEPAQRLSFNQLDQLIIAGEADAAVDLAVQMLDSTDGRLMRVPDSLRTDADRIAENYQPAELAVHDRLLRLGLKSPEVLQLYRERFDGVAKSEWERAVQVVEPEEARKALLEVSRRYFSTSYGDDVLLSLADLDLRAGRLQSAIDHLVRIDPFWQPRSPVPAGVSSPESAAVSATDWNTLLATLRRDPKTPLPFSVIDSLVQQVQNRKGLPLGCYRNSSIPLRQVGDRLIAAYRARGADVLVVELERIVQVAAGEVRGDQDADSLENASAEPKRSAVVVGAPGEKHQRLLQGSARYLQSVDKNSLPPLAAGVNEKVTVRSFPAIVDGVAFIHSGSEVYARSLQTGQPWPPGIGTGAIHVATSGDTLLWPAGLPLSGMPRFDLVAGGRWLVGSFGSRYVGQQAYRSQRTASQLVVLDRYREGALQGGYPVQLPEDYVFASRPVLLGDRCFVAVRSTDGAAQSITLQCYDLPTGNILWASPPFVMQRLIKEQIAVETVPLVLSEERLVCHAEGVTASVSVADGRLQWSVRHQLAELDSGGFPRQRPAAVKSDSALGVVGGEVIVAGVDMDRVVGLNAADGQLRWATAAGVGDDVTHVIGQAAGQWLLGGQQLIWLEALSGDLLSSFPEGDVDQVGGGIDSPAGVGTGVLADGFVYWPTSESIFVFPAAVDENDRGMAIPRMVDRISLRPFGRRGGDLSESDGWILNSTPEAIVVLK